MVTIALLVALMGLLGCVVVEFCLRLLCRPLLYVADDRVGYLLAPNQQTHRWGNRISINQYSMRSSELMPRSPQLRILLLGDSVANGGWWTDQSEIISEQLRSLATSSLDESIEVLNASANSWAPANEMAYLQRFGTFAAQIVILLLNTDDLFGGVPTSAAVGQSSYPDRQPLLAITAALSRFRAAPSLPDSTPPDRVGFNLAAIEQIQAIVTGANGQLLLAMTPLWREINLGCRDYELKARSRLEQFVQTQRIPYVDFLPIFRSIPQPQSLYRDGIHPSVAGNQMISRCLAEQVQRLREK